jgi:hypothetical protein
MASKTCCSICLEDVVRGGIKTECGHEFHGTCLKRWLRTQFSCPYCRQVVPVTMWLDVVRKEMEVFRAAVQTPIPCE